MVFVCAKAKRQQQGLICAKAKRQQDVGPEGVITGRDVFSLRSSTARSRALSFIKNHALE